MYNDLIINLRSHNDHFYKAHKQRCMNFVRSQSGLRLNCRLGPRNRYNMVTILQFYLNISLSKFFVIFFSKLHIGHLGKNSEQ